MTDTSAPERRLTHDILLVLTRDRARHLAFIRGRMSRGSSSAMIQGVDAEDILQLALMRAARHLDGVRDGDRVEAWFWRILRNTISDENQRVARENKLLQQLTQTESEPTPRSMASCACSLGLLEKLRPEHRDLLQQVDIAEEPVVDVATALGITTNNATVRLHRARKALRDALLAHCGTCSTHGCQRCSCDDAP